MPANLELDLLRSFTAVVDTGSFTAAARMVSRTQSAVSMQIKRLEETLGHAVFERNSRSLSLTTRGEMLLDYARRMLALSDESLRRIASPSLEGRLRLGVTEYFVPSELPRILARFASTHPRVQLDVRMGLSRELREELKARRLDAAIVRIDPSRDHDVQVIWHEPQRWVAAEEWSVARGEEIPLVALPAPCVLREFAIETFQQQKRPWRVAYTGSSMASVQAAVVAGLGVSIVGQSSIAAGMRVLPTGRSWPSAGHLHVGVMCADAARGDIVNAITAVTRASLPGRS